MSVSLNQILEMPHAAILAERIQTALENEKAERGHFYQSVDENRKMEFINGEIFFQSPVKIEHNRATGFSYNLLTNFVNKHNLGFVGIEKILISLTRNDYEPDVCFFGNAKAENFKVGQMQFPAPDLAIEVLSDSTAKHDRETKFEDYAAHGVTEYWIIDPKKETVEQYILQGESYELLIKSGNGDITSVVVENFVIPIRAIFDKQTNLETLKKLI